MKTRVRQTSIIAFHSLRDISGRQRAVFEILRETQPACNMDISANLHLPINQITPRTNELVEMGLVKLAHKAPNPITSKTVIYWGLSIKGENLVTKKEQPNQASLL